MGTKFTILQIFWETVLVYRTNIVSNIVRCLRYTYIHGVSAVYCAPVFRRSVVIKQTLVFRIRDGDSFGSGNFLNAQLVCTSSLIDTVLFKRSRILSQTILNQNKHVNNETYRCNHNHLAEDGTSSNSPSAVCSPFIHLQSQ